MTTTVWRVNVSTQSVTAEPVPASWSSLGGRGLVARVLLDEVPPLCDPLGPFNKLLLAPGLLAGQGLSSCDRLSVGGKSPLTGGVKESNAGGTTAIQLARLGVKVLIIEGAPAGENWQVLHLSSEGGCLEPANDLTGLGVYEAAERLLERFGPRVALALIGPAGEMRLAGAGVQNLDKDRAPSRAAGRGGLGALLGSKRLKAIVVDGSGGQKPPLADPELYRQAAKYYLQALREHPQTALYSDYGTAAMTMLCHGLGGLPTRNFAAGNFEGAEKISGEFMRDLILERGGEGQTTHACMPGCVIRCSNSFVLDQEGFAGADGKKIVSPVEYETIGLVGSNLGLDDLDAIARLNWEMNDLGLDTIETGAALGVAAEAGLLEFGDAQRALALLDEVRRGTPLGRLLGQGATTVGQVLGVRRVPAVKGQAMASYDPRAIKGTGVTYATSPQGADHTCGLTIRAPVNHLDPKVQAELSAKGQVNMAGYDTLGACLFAGFGFGAAPGAVRDLLKGRYGWDLGDEVLQVLGRETLALERAFNRAAGFTSADDRLPEWMTREPLPPHNSVFDVPDEDLDRVADYFS